MFAAGLMVFAASQAEAGWREDLGTFRIGLLADPGTGRAIAGLSDIRQAYARALDMPVQVFVARDFAALIDAQATSRIEYAVYSATAFATAKRLCDCVEPLAARQGPQGDIGIRSILLKRDWSVGGGEAKIAVTKPDSTTGSLVPFGAISGSDGPDGIGADQLRVAGSETEAEDLFVSREVNGLFGWAPAGDDANPVLPGGTVVRLRDKGVSEGDLEVRWTSQLLRYGPHTIRSDIDDEAKEILRSFLTGLSETKPDILELLTGSTEGKLVAVKSEDYRLAEDIIANIGN